MKRAGIILSTSNWVNNKAPLIKRRGQRKQWEMSTILNLVGTIAAVAAATAALWLSVETHTGHIHEERPFVAVYVKATRPVISVSPGSNEDLYESVSGVVQTQITVFGKSPAVRVRAICASQIPNKKIVWNPKGPFSSMDFNYLMPGQSMEFYYALTDLDNRMKLGTFLTEYGIIYYQDQSGESYQTPFCEDIYLSEVGILHWNQCFKNDIELPEIR